MLMQPGLILAIALALVHGFATKLPIFKIIPHFRWISFAGGVSLSYVFLEIFPELSHAQEELQHSETLMIQFLENHVYILALVGLLVFYGLDLLAFRFRPRQKQENNSLFFWIHIGIFVILNIIMSYLLQDLEEHSIGACILFFITFALHLFIIDDSLREHQPVLYDQLGRWLLVAAIIFGYVIGQVIHIDEAVISIIWSFLAGTIIFNVLKRELPDANDTCFGSFISGSLLFSILLFSI
ncbi:MAG: hypothetical protein QNJ60_03775 [Xenococcaceae cyanobacterium MO_188.B19]|nr:hypothetical protein [Xenococcaceae cyanobacterium MO_188.B19]